MAKLSSSLLPQVKSTGLARVTSAKTVDEAIASVTARVNAVILVTQQQVIDRTAVAGVVLQGLAQANVLTGKDGSGRPHVSVRTNFFLATKGEVNAFLTKLPMCQSVEAVLTEYYAFIDQHSINGVIWDNEESWNHRGNQSTWSGYLRVDAWTGDVSISGLVPEKPAVVIRAKPLSAALSVGNAPAIPAPNAPAPAPQAPTAPVMKSFNGAAYSVADLLAAGWQQAAIDALPNA